MEAHTRIEAEAMARDALAQREYERTEVAAHYQNDPEIFTRVLGDRLAYSTGIYLDPSEELNAAQDRKVEHIRRMVNIQPGEKVLDAGCGWGSILLYLAEKTEGDLHGITLSSQQRAFLLERAAAAGTADRLRVDLTHIEELPFTPESYDVIFFSGSIVHMHNREEIHQKAARALRPGGRLFISDCYFPVEQRGSRMSAATHYILGETLGYCRLIGLHEELGFIEKAGLDIRLVEDLTGSYTRTLKAWIDNIRTHRPFIEDRAPGFSRTLQKYMTVAMMSFARRSALEYMILASRGSKTTDLLDWAMPGRPA